MKKCPFCAEKINDEAIKCRFCGEFLEKETKQKIKENKYTSETLGVLAVTTPIFFALLMFFWVGNMSLLNNPASSLNLLVILTIIVSTILIVIEASNLKMGDKNDLSKNGKKNSTPGVWFLCLILIWVLFFPIYFFHRKKYSLKNLGFVSIISILVFISSYIFVDIRIYNKIKLVNILQALDSGEYESKIYQKQTSTLIKNNDLKVFLELYPEPTKITQDSLNLFYNEFSKNGSISLLEYFIDNELYSGNNKEPIKGAIDNNRIETIKFLLSKLNLNANFKINHGWDTMSILGYSTLMDKNIIAIHLLTLKPKNYNKNYALFYATKNNNYELVELLLKNKANPIAWIDRTTANIYAKKNYNKNSKIVKILNKYSAEFKKTEAIKDKKAFEEFYKNKDKIILKIVISAVKELDLDLSKLNHYEASTIGDLIDRKMAKIKYIDKNSIRYTLDYQSEEKLLEIVYEIERTHEVINLNFKLMSSDESW